MTPPPRPDSIPPKWNANSTRSQKVILYKEDTKTGTNPSQLRRMTPQKMKEMKQNSKKPTKKAKTKKKHTKRNVLLVFILLLLVGGGIAAWQLGLLKGFGIGGSSSDGNDLLSYSPDYECIVDEDEIDDIVEKYGFPETTKDNSPLFGTYSGDLDEAGVSITLDVPDGDDDRIRNVSSVVPEDLRKAVELMRMLAEDPKATLSKVEEGLERLNYTLEGVPKATHDLCIKIG